MQQYLEPVEDGLASRQAGIWTREKLDYLRRYLDIFTMAMKAKWPERFYVDLFAGPGKCSVREAASVLLGSPLIALTLTQGFTGYFLCEKDPSLWESLVARCQASPRCDLVLAINEDANTGIDTITREIRRRSVAQPALCVAFLDPEGFELHWRTVAELARLPRMDLIIYYPQSGLAREVPNECSMPGETAIDRFFGNRLWRRDYEEPRPGEPLASRLLQRYRQQLQELGYTDVEVTDSLQSPLMRSATKAPLYRLVFASKHKLGNKFWGEVLRRDVHGQRSFPDMDG